MKSDRKKRILAAILCMVMVLSGNISALAEGEVYADPDAVTQMETPEAVSETQPESAPQEPAAEEPPVSTEPAAPEAPAENNKPAAPETPAGSSEPAAPETPAGNNEPAAPEAPEEEDPVFSEETELTKELRDASGKLVQKVTAKLPKGAFEAETSQIEMEVTYVDSSMENYIKGMMEKKLPTDNTLGDYFLYNIQFKVNGEAKESLEPITITFEKSNLEIKDTKKANVFFFDPANPEVSGDKDELVEITQRSELLESLQAAGQSTATMEEDYDLSSIEIKEENRSGKIVLEGRKSTIYGCYVEKEPEEEPEQPEEKPVITRYDYKSDNVNVLVTLTDPADLPDNAELRVMPVTISKEAEEQIEQEAIKEKKAIENIVAYDIKFMVDGKEIQPGATVNVQVSLPTIEAGQDAAVYHVDENDAVENMDGSVNEEGNVTFDTSHFSVYVIVQQGENEVTVTIEHYDNRDSQNPVKIYQEDVRTLPVGGKINNYAKAVNWDVAKVVEVAEDGKETAVNTDTEVQVSSDKKFRVYYTPKKTTTEGAVSFYDYTVRAGSITTDQKTTNYSINMPAYYENGAISQDKLSAGGAESSQVNYTYNYPEYQYTNILIKDGSGNLREANKYLGWGVNQPEQMLKGMVKGLDAEGNVVFNYAQPGFFNDLDLTFDLNGITRYLRKVYKDYKLEFNQIGDTYQLSKVYNGSGISVASAGSNFWPLDGVRPNYDGYADTNNLPDRGTNPYFGMRYDVTFKIGDYIGPLNYSFTGDDDFWVILDGSKVVIDLGGIHNACTDSVDLWEYLLNKGQKVGELTTEQKEQEHTLTILYMERGAGKANCNMNFTLPSAQISEVDKVPMSDLVLKKVNKAGDALEGARFTLLDSNGSTVAVSTSTKEGAVKFSKLREGTYTLREDVAPTGYIPSVDTWIVKVSVDNNGAATATMYLSDGKTEYTDMSGSVYKVLNVTKQELIDSSMNYNKTVHVKNWDQRTYDINITASSKLTSSTSVEKDAVVDMMLVFDASGSMLYSNSSDKSGLLEKGSFKDVKDTLDTTALYYYTNRRTIIQNDKGSDYSNASHPMIFMDDKWQYYSVSYGQEQWIEVEDNDETEIYTLNSKLNALKEAATSFINSAAIASSESRLGIVAFNYQLELKNALETLNSESAKQLVKTISSLRARGGTRPQLGLEYAYDRLKENKREGIPQYVILFSDGDPSTTNDQSATETKADTIKQDGIVIYTVGLGLNDETEKWLSDEVASKGYAFTADTADELKEIFQKIQSTITKNLDIKNAQIKDVVDPRFVILDDKGRPITEDYPGIKDGIVLNNGGKVTYVEDENGNKYQQIVWTEQTIPYNKDGKQWNQTFTVAAKEEYIGGNDVTTNISPNSSITTSYGDAVLPQPTVNVKSDLIVKDKEVTIYYGDKVPTKNEILKALFNKEKPTGNITKTSGENKTVTYTMGTDGKPIDSEDFTMKWYQDEQCTQEITLDEMKDTMPEPVEQKYYLKVSYDALGNSTDMSEANTDKYISNGEAHFETDTERECGIYTINVIKGQIQITKTLDKAASKDETFTFLVHKMEEEIETPIAEINITVPQGATTASYVFEQDGNNTDPLQKLKRGTYIVREKEHDSFAVQKVVIGEETDCYSDSEPETARFVLGNNKENKDVISDTYTYAKDGVLGVAHFTNESIIKNWQIVKRSSSDKNLVLPGAEFKLTPDEKNTVPKTYIGISREKGIVKWYETNENGEKLDTEVTQFEPGTYVFSETKAPSGYQKSEETWTIKLSSKGLIRLEGVKEDNVKIEVVDNKTIYKYYFENTPVYELPSTGGTGIFVYTIGGTLLLMAAVLLIYKMKREEVLKG